MATGGGVDLINILNRRERIPKFFCHGCQKTFGQRVNSPDPPRCPTCNSEFVEQLEQEEERTVGANRLGGGEEEPMDIDPGPEDVRDHLNGANPLGGGEEESMDVDPGPEDVRDHLNPLRRRRFQRQPQRQPLRPPQRQPQRGGAASEHRTAGIGISVNEAVRRLPRRTVIIQQQPPESFAALMHDYMTRMVGGLAGRNAGERREQPAPPQFGPQIFIGLPLPVGGFLHGNPGDYAWGPAGLDHVISQLLASLEDSGPPPAEKEKVEALPTISATPEDLKICSDCSVCKENLKVGESVRKLPCEHLYHDDCILPWLNLHDTCPICRYSINTGKPATG